MERRADVLAEMFHRDQGSSFSAFPKLGLAKVLT